MAIAERFQCGPPPCSGPTLQSGSRSLTHREGGSLVLEVHRTPGLGNSRCNRQNGRLDLRLHERSHKGRQLTADEAAAAFKQLSGDSHASLASALIRSSESARALPLNHLRDSLQSENTQDGRPCDEALRTNGGYSQRFSCQRNIWAEVIGNWQSQDGDGNAPSYKQRVGGVQAGGDIRVGDGLDEASILGPVQNAMQFNKVRELVEDAKVHGGRILIGGEAPGGDGYFYPITLVADVDNGVRLVDEEQFGPVLPIIRYRDLDEVIRRANDNPAGLGGSVWSGDPEKARAVALQLECGSVWINKHGAIQPNAPFGGVKQSGIGVEFGVDGLKEFTTIQTVLS